MTKITGKSIACGLINISWRDYMREAADLLSSAGIEEPLQEVRYLTGIMLDIGLAQLVANQDDLMTPQQYELMMKSIRLRANHVPASYIVGRSGFYGRDFMVGQGVLIPRPDTETLIEEVVKRSSILPAKLRMLDTFTGSGCIGITLALELAGAGHTVELDLADISSDALEFARRNVEIHGLTDSCKIHQVDIWPDTESKWDLITANPPYINSGVISGLQLEVRDNEPLMALDGGVDGLHFYREIFSRLECKLVPGGIFACEHGFDQAEAISQIAADYGCNDIYQYNDLGGNPRVTICDKM